MSEIQNPEKHKIEIRQVTPDEIKEKSGMEIGQLHNPTLFWAKEGENIRLLFCSNDKDIRALEFMDYLVEDYAMVRGDSKMAHAVIEPVFLQIMMSEAEVGKAEALLDKLVEQYYITCNWIYAKQYAEEHRSMILKMSVYVKKRKPWAYVKTTDIVKEGETFLLKSLENESEIKLKASEKMYIMIGCKGEIYHIEREKFERTYEVSEDVFDIYEMMTDYIPEIRKYESEEFISLDELAHLCYPKQAAGIYASCLESRTKVFNPYNQGEYFLGRKGDYLAVRRDDLTDIYIIKKEIFNETYEAASM